MTEETELLTTDDLMVAALADGASQREAAVLAGVSDKTVQRRMGRPEFARRVAVARTARVTEHTGRITMMGDTALAVLRDAMCDRHAIEVRLRAATAVLRHGRELRSNAELEERIAALEDTTQRFANADPASEVRR